MSDPIMERIASYFERKWPVIYRAWPALIITAVVVGFLVWLGISMYYKASYEGTIRELTAARDTTEQRRLQAQDRVDELQSQLGKSDRKVESYTIREEDEMEFVQIIRTLDRVGDIEIAHTDGDIKATALAKRISTLFELCSWDVREWKTAVATIGLLPPGVTIWASKEYGSIPPAAGVLKTLLTKYNIQARIRWLDPEEKVLHPFSSLRIFIGPEPQALPKK